MTKRKRATDEKALREPLYDDPVNLIVGEAMTVIKASRSALSSNSNVLQNGLKDEWRKEAITLKDDDPRVIQKIVNVTGPFHEQYILDSGSFEAQVAATAKLYQISKIIRVQSKAVEDNLSSFTPEMVADEKDLRGWLLLIILIDDPKVFQMVTGKLTFLMSTHHENYGHQEVDNFDLWETVMISDEHLEKMIEIMNKIYNRYVYLFEVFEVIMRALDFNFGEDKVQFGISSKISLQSNIEHCLPYLKDLNSSRAITYYNGLREQPNKKSFGLCSTCYLGRHEDKHSDESNEDEDLVQLLCKPQFEDDPVHEIALQRHKNIRNPLQSERRRKVQLACGSISTLIKGIEERNNYIKSMKDEFEILHQFLDEVFVKSWLSRKESRCKQSEKNEAYNTQPVSICKSPASHTASI